MLYFTLPDFFELSSLNNYFVFLNTNQPSVFKTDLKFTALAGNFSYNYWDGSHCNMLGPGAFALEITDFTNKGFIPLRYSCNNLFIEETDFENTFNNLILDAGQKRNNEIEIANFKLLDYLEEHYSNYRYILSRYAHYMTAFTPELINNIINFNKFALIQIPEQLMYDKQFLSEIENKSKLEVMAGSVCPITCTNFDQCVIQQHQNQYNYSKNSPQGKCALTKNKLHIMTLSELEDFYKPFGITHFCLPSLRNSLSYLEIINFYVQYFIKEEYQFKILIDIEHIFGKEISNDPFYYTRPV